MNGSSLHEESGLLVSEASQNQPDLVRRLPDSFKLQGVIPVADMQKELLKETPVHWGMQQTVVGGKLVASDVKGWRVLSLRSVGGNPGRTDAGGADQGLVDWTAHAERFPAMRSFLETLPVELSTVRLMALSPGQRSPEHVDSCVGLPWGRLRLHVPLLTSVGAKVAFEGRETHWDAGLWYGSFSLPHYIVNRSDRFRLHLVIDGTPHREFLDLIPSDIVSRLSPGDALIPSVRGTGLRDAELPTPSSVYIPAEYLQLAGSFGQISESKTLVRCNLERVTDTAIVMNTEDGRRFILVRCVDDAYRVLGWPHRSMSLHSSDHALGIRLISTVGALSASRVVALIRA